MPRAGRCGAVGQRFTGACPRRGSGARLAMMTSPIFREFPYNPIIRLISERKSLHSKILQRISGMNDSQWLTGVWCSNCTAEKRRTRLWHLPLRHHRQSNPPKAKNMSVNKYSAWLAGCSRVELRNGAVHKHFVSQHLIFHTPIVILTVDLIPLRRTVDHWSGNKEAHTHTDLMLLKQEKMRNTCSNSGPWLHFSSQLFVHVKREAGR